MPDGSLSDIEQKVARDRAALADSLDSLSRTLDPDHLRNVAAETVDHYGRNLGNQTWTALRDNPAGFALVGAGLALLLSGTGQRTPDDATSGSVQGRGMAKRPGTPAAPPEAALEGFDARVAAADNATRGTEQPPSASRMRATLQHGLDKLPPKARARVLRARSAAADAQEAIEMRAARTARRAGRIAQERPVAVAGAAFGLGAAIAALLPATEREDEVLGAQRDALMRAARKAAEAEFAQLRRAAERGMAASSGPASAPAPAPEDPAMRSAAMRPPS